MTEFLDHQSFEHLRTELWAPGGHAAVMVGAGFSRNARAKDGGPAVMPLWRELIVRIARDLYPGEPDEQAEAIRRAGAVSGVLRLAEEFETAFGRSELDRLLMEEIPDATVEPGPLHRLLLELPWADVLTTNYDTLLERARDLPVIRPYGLVQTAEDIPRRKRPRIVKLHGSFPATRPFVFTEEDFRRYPESHAPFVNLARGVVMENVLCLLGFSGDDPNFLHWTGWVRDRLGGAVSNVYLCGILNLTQAKRRLLEKQRVLPIALDDKIPRDSPDRHRLATEWFLLSLEAGRPPNRLRWPELGEQTLTPPSSSLVPPRVPRADHT